MKANLKFSALISSALLVSLSLSTQAADFTVNDTVDSVDINPGDGVCATAIGSCTLRAAVMEANALEGADTIILPEGIFKIALGETGEDLGAEGDLDISDDLTITGAGQSLTEISSHNNSHRLFSVLRNEEGDSPSVSISNVTMTEGLEFGDAALVYSEGDLSLDSVVLSNAGTESNALYVARGNLVLTNSEINSNYRGIYVKGGRASISESSFSANRSTGEGAAILNEHGVISVDKSSFIDNMASNGGAIKSSSRIAIDNSLFESNSSEEGNGGALFIDPLSSHFLVKNSSFISNQADKGGAFYTTSLAGVIEGSNFSSNQASDEGGALYDGTGVILVGSSFISNSAGRIGGAIYNGGLLYSGDLAASNILVSDNEAEFGAGGIHMESGSISNSRVIDNRAPFVFSTAGGIYANEEIQLSFSEVSGNSAALAGGIGIGDSNADGNSVILNSTIANNTADLHSAGLHLNSGSLEIINSTFAYNALPLETDTRGTSIDIEDGAVRLRNTLIYSEDSPQNCVGNIESLGNNFVNDSTCGHNAVLDLLNPILLTGSKLGELKDNGGMTHTIELEPEHPAIDAGDGQYCHSDNVLDQRYYLRNDSACDIGAYEVGSRKAIAGTLSFSSANYEVNEDAGSVIVTVSRTGGREGEAIAWVYDTGQGEATPDSASDYELFKPITLTWADGEDNDKTIEIDVYNQTTYFGLHENTGKPIGFLEGDETFTLGMVQGGIANLGIDETTITIIDIDGMGIGDNDDTTDDSSNDGDDSSDNSDEPAEGDQGSEQDDSRADTEESSTSSSGGGSMNPLLLVALSVLTLIRRRFNTQ